MRIDYKWITILLLVIIIVLGYVNNVRNNREYKKQRDELLKYNEELKKRENAALQQAIRWRKASDEANARAERAVNESRIIIKEIEKDKLIINEKINSIDSLDVDGLVEFFTKL